MSPPSATLTDGPLRPSSYRGAPFPPGRRGQNRVLAPVAVADEHDGARERDRDHEHRVLTVDGQDHRDQQARECDGAEDQRRRSRGPAACTRRCLAAATCSVTFSSLMSPRTPCLKPLRGPHNVSLRTTASKRGSQRRTGLARRKRVSTEHGVRQLRRLARRRCAPAERWNSPTRGERAAARPLRRQQPDELERPTHQSLRARVRNGSQAHGRNGCGRRVQPGRPLESRRRPYRTLDGDWDVVVMQQGPSSLPESQVHLRLWTGRFAAVARSAGTQPGLLTVWPESYRKAALGDVIVSYRRAAEAAKAELFPAGAAWRAAWSCNSRLQLYGPDGFHPSRLGTHLAALVVYGRLFTAPLLSSTLAAPGVPPRTSRLLQAAAATALGRALPRARRCGR